MSREWCNIEVGVSDEYGERSAQLEWFKQKLRQHKNSKSHVVCQKTKCKSKVHVLQDVVYESIDTFLELSELCFKLHDRKCVLCEFKTEKEKILRAYCVVRQGKVWQSDA